jgi:TRAP transporter TAXI family solute receptor
LVISAKVPEERVYQMTKAVFESLGDLAGVHPAFGRVSKDTVLNGFGAPLHPGALRYYREIGVPGIEEFVTRTGG